MAEKKTNYKIIEEIRVLDISPTGWKKEFNVVSWFDQEPKYDIRWWHPERLKSGKGITLSKEEMTTIFECITKQTAAIPLI